jgi:hypothetical protein
MSVSVSGENEDRGWLCPGLHNGVLGTDTDTHQFLNTRPCLSSNGKAINPSTGANASNQKKIGLPLALLSSWLAFYLLRLVGVADDFAKENR